MKILVGYRGTNVGKDLLELAAQHAKAFSADVLLVTSLPGGDKTTKEHVFEAEEKLEKEGRLRAKILLPLPLIKGAMKFLSA